MANPPPPYDNITGISRAVMKDNAQETLANYNGNARPGELVVNLVVDPPALYVGNNLGQLTAIGSGGSAGLPLANGTSNFDIAAANSNATVSVAGTGTWTFDTTSNLNLPVNGNINFNAGGIAQSIDEDFVITVNDADNDGFAIFNRVTDDANAVLGQTELRRDRLNINLDITGSNYQWQFSDNQGILYLPGNISGNYGTDASFFVTDNGSGGTMEMKTISYVGDTLGSNVRVTQSNATISTSNAAYTWTFDNTGKMAAPGPIQMAVYANATVRDAAITSPTPGMMIYVTGTGMQVRGATSWNTIAGSGT